MQPIFATVFLVLQQPAVLIEPNDLTILQSPTNSVLTVKGGGPAGVGGFLIKNSKSFLVILSAAKDLVSYLLG